MHRVHELTSSIGNLDTRNLRNLTWVDGMRYWNISKMVADAKVKKPSYITRDRMMTKGYLAVDLIGTVLNGFINV